MGNSNTEEKAIDLKELTAGTLISFISSNGDKGFHLITSIDDKEVNTREFFDGKWSSRRFAKQFFIDETLVHIERKKIEIFVPKGKK